jgi:hypothetical protein
MVLANPANVHVQSKQHMHVQNNPANVHVQNKQHVHVQNLQTCKCRTTLQTCMCRTSNICMCRASNICMCRTSNMCMCRTCKRACAEQATCARTVVAPYKNRVVLLVLMTRVGQNRTYISPHGTNRVFWAGKSLSIRSCTVHIFIHGIGH